jgi:TorA maturation chaperone TorD
MRLSDDEANAGEPSGIANRMNQLTAQPNSRAALPIPLTPEDQARADLYALIACLLLTAPNAALLADLANADSLASQQTDGCLDLAWEKLVLAAGVIGPDAIQEEFNALFTGIGTPQVNLYASLYLAGFMMEQPLAELRSDLMKLGLARIPGSELEDHLAALCETMRILISGEQGAGRQSIQCQKAFFEQHIAPWYSCCLNDIRAAAGTNFYLQVADFIQAFFDIEAQAFAMEETCHGE